MSLPRSRVAATLLAVVTAAWASAQAPPPPDEAPLPDEAALLAEVLASQNAVDEARDAYTYTMTVTDLADDSRGHPAPRQERTYEVFSVAGKRFRRMTARDGRPLPPEEPERRRGGSRRPSGSIARR